MPQARRGGGRPHQDLRARPRASSPLPAASCPTGGGSLRRRAVAEYPQYSPRVLSRDPWLVTFDNLLSDEAHPPLAAPLQPLPTNPSPLPPPHRLACPPARQETDGIVEAVGGKSGEYLKPSTTAKATRGKDGRVVLQDVPDQIRTSYNAWCQHPGCYNHPVLPTAPHRGRGAHRRGRGDPLLPSSPPPIPSRCTSASSSASWTLSGCRRTTQSTCSCSSES